MLQPNCLASASAALSWFASTSSASSHGIVLLPAWHVALTRAPGLLVGPRYLVPIAGIDRLLTALSWRAVSSLSIEDRPVHYNPLTVSHIAFDIERAV